MKTTASHLIQWAGVSATVAGIMYVLVGLLHPFVSHHAGLSSVTTEVWVLTHSLTIGVSFFGLLGMAGLYARQVEKAAWLGLLGFLLRAASGATRAARNGAGGVRPGVARICALV
jgi:hypothetical protein